MRETINYPIINDPIALIAVAFERLHPDKKYEAYYDFGLKDSAGNPVWGQTLFPDDGSTTQIFINVEVFETENGLANAAEIFAHELAHCAVGAKEEHSGHWDEEFERIFMTYNEIAAERGLAEVNDGN